MGEEIPKALDTIKNSRGILKILNNTFLVLIPKIESCIGFQDFRSKPLCNTL